MFSGKTTDDLLWALALFFITKHLGLGGRGEGGPRPIPAPQVELQPGAYWYFLNDAKELERYADWLWRVRANAHHIKYLGARGVSQSVVIFLVHDYTTAKWDLPGLPTSAPKGIATEIEDIEGKGPSSVSPDTWQEYLGAVIETTGDVAQRIDSEIQRWLTERLREKQSK